MKTMWMVRGGAREAHRSAAPAERVGHHRFGIGGARQETKRRQRLAVGRIEDEQRPRRVAQHDVVARVGRERGVPDLEHVAAAEHRSGRDVAVLRVVIPALPLLGHRLTRRWRHLVEEPLVVDSGDSRQRVDMRGCRVAADRQRQGEGEQRHVVHPADGRLGHGQAEPEGAQQEQPVAQEFPWQPRFYSALLRLPFAIHRA